MAFSPYDFLQLYSASLPMFWFSLPRLTFPLTLSQAFLLNPKNTNPRKNNLSTTDIRKANVRYSRISTQTSLLLQSIHPSLENIWNSAKKKITYWWRNCANSDWLIIGFEFSRVSNHQSRTLYPTSFPGSWGPWEWGWEADATNY